MSPSGGRFTARGWYVASGAVLMILLAALFGIEELYALAASCAAALACAAVWTKRQGRLEFAEATDVRPRRAGPGTSPRAHLVLAGPGLRATPRVTVSIPLRRVNAGDLQCRGPVVSRSPAFCLPGLSPGAQAVATLRLPIVRRGIWAIGPVTVTLCDPLGLTERQWTGRAESYFVVHPSVFPLAVPPRWGRMADPEMTRHHLPAARGPELHSLREYQDGDDLRQVHWRATARWDRLMVRQDETSPKWVVCVGVDLRAGHHTPESFDSTLDVAASIACMVLSGAGADVRVTTTDGDRWGPRRGTGARTGVLDVLAKASLHQGPPSAPLFGEKAEVAVLVSPTERAARELLAAESGVRSRSVVGVVTSETAPIGEPDAVLRHFDFFPEPVMVVRAGYDPEAAWADAVGHVWPGPAGATRGAALATPGHRPKSQ